MEASNLLSIIGPISWDDVFAGWEAREAGNPSWVACARDKGFPDWASWRLGTAAFMGLPERAWSLYRIAAPSVVIPRLLVGPFGGWQAHCPAKNRTTFADLLAPGTPGEAAFRANSGVARVRRGLPFATQLIALQCEADNRLVCIEGHHRAAAITLARNDGEALPWDGIEVTIVIASVSSNEDGLFDRMLARGTSRDPLA